MPLEIDCDLRHCQNVSDNFTVALSRPTSNAEVVRAEPAFPVFDALENLSTTTINKGNFGLWMSCQEVCISSRIISRHLNTHKRKTFPDLVLGGNKEKEQKRRITIR